MPFLGVAFNMTVVVGVSRQHEPKDSSLSRCRAYDHACAVRQSCRTPGVHSAPAIGFRGAKWRTAQAEKSGPTATRSAPGGVEGLLNAAMISPRENRLYLVEANNLAIASSRGSDSPTGNASQVVKRATTTNPGSNFPALAMIPIPR